MGLRKASLSLRKEGDKGMFQMVKGSRIGCPKQLFVELHRQMVVLCCAS